jgi:hypothetical protein
MVGLLTVAKLCLAALLDAREPDVLVLLADLRSSGSSAFTDEGLLPSRGSWQRER